MENLSRLGKGEIYIDVGNPIGVEPNSSKKKLAQRAPREAARCSRVTMPAWVCCAISKEATLRDALQHKQSRIVYFEFLNRLKLWDDYRNVKHIENK